MLIKVQVVKMLSTSVKYSVTKYFFSPNCKYVVSGTGFPRGASEVQLTPSLSVRWLSRQQSTRSLRIWSTCSSPMMSNGWVSNQRNQNTEWIWWFVWKQASQACYARTLRDVLWPRRSGLKAATPATRQRCMWFTYWDHTHTQYRPWISGDESVFNLACILPPLGLVSGTSSPLIVSVLS